jgi:hypothetical protein
MNWKHYVVPELLRGLAEGTVEILDALEVHLDLPLRLRGENDREYLDRWISQGIGIMADWEIDIVRKALKLLAEPIPAVAPPESAEDAAQREFMMQM